MRQHLTPRERAAMYEAQNGLCSCGCGRKLGEHPYHEEHTIPNYFVSGKPDALMVVDPCHRDKTRRDIKAIAKVRRLRGETKGRPKRDWGKQKFDTRYRRKVDGTVERRT